MDKKYLTMAATAVITLAVTLGGTWLVTTLGAGQDAAEEKQIRDVVASMMVTPSGETYGAILIRIDKEVAATKAAVDVLVAE